MVDVIFSPLCLETDILFIKGITKEDVMSEMIQNIPVETTINFRKSNTESIPEVFIDISTWPTSTNLRCKSCHLRFSCRPFPVIKALKIERDIEIYSVHKAACCTLMCADKLNRRFFKESEAKINTERMLEVYNKHFAKFNKCMLSSVPRINISPTELDIYIGADGHDLFEYQQLINKWFNVTYHE
jgi:hypothetical protein